MRTLLAVAAVLAASTAAAQSVTLNVIPPPPDVAAPPPDAAKTPSGLSSKTLAAGTGANHPAAADLVKVHYTGWTTDGRMFDSSVSRGRPSTFRVNGVIPGFSEGLQLMVAGEKRRLWIPESLAYKGEPGKPAGTLVFDVELLDIPNRPPPDVKAPPPDATKTASGLAYKVIAEGTGGRHPKASSSVTVHYTGWTTDGKMFDSSVARGQPATFRLADVIAGWTEGLQLMFEGGKMRFWIPEKLAYQGKQAPYGMLVFDIELMKIE